MTKKKAGKSTKKSAKPAGNAPPTMPVSAEQVMQNLARILNEQNFGSIDEANAFLEELMSSTGGFVPAMKPRSALEEAQGLIYQAWESPNRSQRIKLARRALEISPDCADAYVVLAEFNAKTPAEARALYEQGVKAGERALAEAGYEFKELVEHFWGVVETRPYMRARLGLAQALWALGEFAQAADHMREMLRLNPNDNQGVRYLLVTLLTQMGDDDALEKLLAQYADDWSANWKYASALQAFRKEGKSQKAQNLLRDAIECNRFVPLFLLGRKRIPRTLPAFISPGHEDEAIHYAADAISAWQKTPGAMEWLAEVLVQSQSKSE